MRRQLEAVLTTETDLGWFDPLLHLAFLGIIGAFHWKRRWPGPGLDAAVTSRP